MVALRELRTKVLPSLGYARRHYWWLVLVEAPFEERALAKYELLLAKGFNEREARLLLMSWVLEGLPESSLLKHEADYLWIRRAIGMEDDLARRWRLDLANAWMRLYEDRFYNYGERAHSW